MTQTIGWRAMTKLSIHVRVERAWRYLAALTMWSCAAPALAATVTASFQVTTTVQPTCQIQTTNLAFPQYANAVDPGTATITVTCSNTTPYTIGIDAGGGTSASVTTRSLNGPGAAKIGYGLFSDAAHSVNWGMTPGTDTVSGTGTGSAQVLTVYGQVPAGQIYANAGQFSDTVTATVTY
jgi:spore coat protein U-like protein